MINVIDMQLALSFKWIKELQNEGSGMWRVIPTYFYSKFGENLCVFNSNVKFKELQGVDDNFPFFYRKLLEVFLEYNKLKIFSDKGSKIIWNNSLIKYSGKVFF